MLRGQPRPGLFSNLLFVLPVALAGMLGVHTLNSIYQDIGRHIRLGGIIRATHSVPATNLFSYTNPDFPFINHHWLAEVGMYAGNAVAGLTGLIAIKALLLMVAFALAFAACWRAQVAGLAAAIGLVTLLILAERTDVRPEILSFVFVGWFLFVLWRRPSMVWTLPVVQLVWVNSHIYFFMGPLLWAAWIVGEMFRGRTRAIIERKTIAVTGLLVAATLCNPHFIEGAIYPLRVFGNYGYTVAENQTALFMWRIGYGKLTTIALGAGFVIAVTSFVVNRRNWRRNMFGATGCVLTAVLAVMMIRNYPLFALVMLPAAIRNFEEAGVSLSWVRIPAAGALVAFAVFIVGGQFYRWARMDRAFGLIIPEGHQRPVDHFRLAGMKGPIFNNFDIGSFLIWRLPEERVFIDGRPEAYPAQFIQDVYIPMQGYRKVWEEKSAAYGINTVIWNTADATPWSKAFVERITTDPSWMVAFFGDGVLILLRATEANLRILEAHPPVIIPR